MPSFPHEGILPSSVSGRRLIAIASLDTTWRNTPISAGKATNLPSSFRKRQEAGAASRYRAWRSKWQRLVVFEGSRAMERRSDTC